MAALPSLSMKSLLVLSHKKAVSCVSDSILLLALAFAR